MSEYMFGLGSGHLPRKANTIAKKHGAELVNYTDPGCKCGYGCISDCPACKRHWFTGPNYGAPFDQQIATAVMSELAATGIKS